jgi:phage FluMu protein Com
VCPEAEKNYTRFYWKGPNVTKVNAVTIKEERYVKISNRFENIDDIVDNNRT